MKMKKSLFYLFCFFVAIIIFLSLFFLVSNRRTFADMADLEKNRPVDYNRFPLSNAICLIPKTATQITVIYKANRIKNIQIYFKLRQSVQNDYIETLKTQLHEYKIMNPNDNRKVIIYFKGTEYTCFKQIDFMFSYDSVQIETF